ncbi:MAG: translation initiation factor IF-2 N-terminal domain-containing protein, partial [Acidimicrobiales bacterium]
MPTKRIRVYELARELGLTNKEALDLCLGLGIGVKSHSSSLEDQQADRVRRKADREGLRREVQPDEEPPTRGASKPSRAPASEPESPAATEAPAPLATETRPVAPRLVTSRQRGEGDEAGRLQAPATPTDAGVQVPAARTAPPSAPPAPPRPAASPPPPPRPA